MQRAAYEMGSSDWSSAVCSSDPLGAEGWYLRRARCEALLVAAALIALRVGEIGHHVGRPMIGDVEVRCDLVGRQVRRRSGDERDRCSAEVEEDAVHRIDEHADDLLVVQRGIYFMLIGVARSEEHTLHSNNQ